MLGLAYECLRRGGSATCTLNAADEVAVSEFLEGRISYTGMAEVVEETLNRVPVTDPPSIEAVLEIDRQSRAVARDVIREGVGRPASERILARV